MTRFARHHAPRKALVLLAVCAAFAPAFAIPTPAVAQELRLDVPYVPTAQTTVDEMLKLAGVKAGDHLIDLGCGDGRIVVSAAKLGATAMGVDINPTRIKESNENAKAAGVTDKVKFFEQNLFDTKIADATVMSMYLLPSVNLQLRPRILSELKPGTRIVSHDFDMGDWKPDQFKDLGTDQVFFWLVPAQVAGAWTAKVGNDSYRLDLTQKFQDVAGSASMGGKTLQIENAKLSGENISLDIVDGASRKTLTGKVAGNGIAGSGWSATKS
ncbi:MAG TPA: methyltransferase domain-containing protein [Alphaproteobacteria bacterium]|jgi:SAM-dependent methyltransferase